MVGGYRHARYVGALAELGAPVHLSGSGGSLLQRPIPQRSESDAIGPYPLFCCDDWTALADDLAALAVPLVSVSLVADPFGDWTLELLDAAFPDRRVPFKEHFAVALGSDPLRHASRHHQRFAARGRRLTTTELLAKPSDYLDDWTELYDGLVRRRGVRGAAAFSRVSFEQQFSVPGLLAFRATESGATVGMSLWYCDRDIAYWHLAAYSGRGYKLDASYALLSAALEHLSEAGLRWACLGAGPGHQADPKDGLTRFKAGWASETRVAHFCGVILDPEQYHALGETSTSFFPAYRGATISE